MVVNTAKVQYALSGVLRIAPELEDFQRSALKDAFGAFRRLEEDPEIPIVKMKLFADAIKVAGDSLAVYAQSCGLPYDTEVNKEDSDYAKLLLREAGLLTAPRNRQKFTAATEEEPTTPETDKEEEAAPEKDTTEKPPARRSRKKKTD